MSNAAAKSQTDAQPDEPRPVTDPKSGKAFAINPHLCTQNDPGVHHFRHWLVRLPSQVRTTQDLHDMRGLWAKVQVGDHSIGKFDDLRIVSAGDEWYVDATCLKSTATDVELHIKRVVELPERTDALPSDETYECRYEDGCFQFFRRADQQRMHGSAATIPEALRLLNSYYPRRVA